MLVSRRLVTTLPETKKASTYIKAPENEKFGWPMEAASYWGAIFGLIFQGTFGIQIFQRS